MVYCPSCEERVVCLYDNHNICLRCFRSYLKDKIEDLLLDICRWEKDHPEQQLKASSAAVLKALEKEYERVFVSWTTQADPTYLWELTCLLLPKEQQVICAYTDEIQEDEEQQKTAPVLSGRCWFSRPSQQELRLSNLQDAMLQNARIGKKKRK